MPLRSGDLVASGVDAYVIYAKAQTAGYLYILSYDQKLWTVIILVAVTVSSSPWSFR